MTSNSGKAAVAVGVAVGALATGWLAHQMPGAAAADNAFHEAGREPTRVLVIGDSTAVGTGSPPEGSVAGRLAADFPSVHIDNRGRDGATLAATLEQLAQDAGSRPSLLLLMVGGNDIVRLVPTSTMERELEQLLTEAVRRSDNVVLVSPGNLATAPGLWWPLDRILGWRSRRARALFDRVAARHPVTHVSLFREPDADPFALEPGRYFSEDGIHPSAEGYGMWYRTLRMRVPLDRLLR